MVPRSSNMTRSSSTDSSTLSNILVATVEDDGFNSEHEPVSTPPTSLGDDGSIHSAKATVSTFDIAQQDETAQSGRRSKRVRTGPSTYNLKKAFDAQEAAGSSSSRNVSGLTGRTLVDDDDDGAFLGKKVLQTTEMDGETTGPTNFEGKAPAKVSRRPSVKDRFRKAANKITSVLGKRKVTESELEESPKQTKIMKELDMGSKGLLEEMDLSDDDFDIPQPRPAKRAKVSATVPTAKPASQPTAAPLTITNGKRAKTWLNEGLYVGQQVDMDYTQGGRKKLQKRSGASPAPNTNGPALPLPMFGYLDNARDFVVPFDVYATSVRKDVKVPGWTERKNQKNRLVGDAKEIMKRRARLASSMCICEEPEEGELACGEACINRIMHYECDESNCRFEPSQCSNRVFVELEERIKNNDRYGVGVEIVATMNRGFGIRSCRVFTPGQIIMEYTGEVITELECERRVIEDYKDAKCYYFMQLDSGLVIDGTKGSMARFINHSCDPNCEVRMVKVDGKPRMAVFAGIKGVMTGEELTYDYNFDNFGAADQKCYCGASNCRGTLSKRLTKAEQAIQDRLEEQRRLEAEEVARKAAAAEEKKKKVKNDRGSGWRGWVPIDDMEVRAELRAEKKAKEEAEKNSSRAQRAARRLTGTPAPLVEKAKAAIKKSNSKRRKTIGTLEQEDPLLGPEPSDDATTRLSTTTSSELVVETTHQHAPSAGSRFREEIERPASALPHVSTTTTVKKTEVTVSTTAARGVEMVRSVGEAVKKGLLGLEKGTGGGKLRQSTL